MDASVSTPIYPRPLKVKVARFFQSKRPSPPKSLTESLPTSRDEVGEARLGSALSRSADRIPHMAVASSYTTEYSVQRSTDGEPETSLYRFDSLHLRSRRHDTPFVISILFMSALFIVSSIPSL
ncbi:fungal mating-type pheromone [Coprinopsis cinerea okayama7|uniref:Fungal mating-type pheromone n=1 Tax=Coprinopsis cinerea (strain Okayama-7 / 130 / ATCC MYA-4618 / FGSC 9003) TaxID=240176 RepID=D6RQ19_COPC7|nr:fungal mating-type pheromone [Coprinopsis cinerea okayama7\|eukprot:XP_002910433.1 fungal mating-type pheromone [Coprinopsis cinerea okayama7\